MLIALVTILALVFTPILVFAEEQSETEPPSMVIISEVGWAGSEVNNSDEWLELTNLGDQEVDLTGWSIVGAATGGDVLVLPETSVQPNSTFLITNYAPDDEKSTLNVEPNFTSSSLSLSNSAFGISLQNATGTVIDIAGDGSAPTTGSRGTDEEGNTVPRSSMQRAFLVDGSLEQAWMAAIESVGFDESATELGTPGTFDTFATHDTIETLNEHTYDSYQNDSATEDEDDQSETEDPVAETDPTNPASSGLIINEFVSDPITGENEWVEVYNSGDEVYILAGYTIREASGKTTNLPDQYLTSGQYVVVESIKGNLNNSGDTIELLDADGAVLDSVAYGDGSEAPAVTDPNAVALNENNEWQETTITTPGEANVISDEVQEVVELETEEDEEIETTEEPETIEESVVEEVTTEAEETETVVEETVTNNSDNQKTSQPDNQSYDLRLSELYPNTTGTDSEEEFVELTNTGSETIDLLGWSLADASGKAFTAEASQTIEPGAHLALYRETTNLALNNSGTESVVLTAPDGVAVDQFTYETTTNGESFILLNGAWVGTSHVTPNEPNSLSQPETEPVTTEVISESVVTPDQSPVVNSTSPAATVTAAPTQRVVYTTSTSSYSPSSSVVDVALSSVRSLSKGTKVRATGTVSAEPGLLGTQIMYLAGSGIQVYLHAANWPEVSAGDVVQVTGELSSSRSESRIKLSSPDDLTVLYGGDDPIPHEVELEEIDEDTEGWLVMVNGLVQSVESDRFVLEDNGETVTVLIKDGTDIGLNDIEIGSRLLVTGIVSRYYDNFRVLPRSTNDIETLEEALVTAAGISSKDQATAGRAGFAIALGLTTISILGYLAFRYYRSRQDQLPSFTARTIEPGAATT